MKSSTKRAQTAIEYMLLLTICALIAFVGFRTFFQEGGRVREATNEYFTKVQEEIMGEAPSLSTDLPIWGGPETCDTGSSWVVVCSNQGNCEDVGCRSDASWTCGDNGWKAWTGGGWVPPIPGPQFACFYGNTICCDYGCKVCDSSLN